MTGGTVAIIIAMLFVLLIVAVIALAIFLMIKFAYVIIPAGIITMVLGKRTGTKKRKKK